MPASDVTALRDPLEAVMREAGELARATARGPFKRWTKGADHSPVTEADIAVNEFLRERLGALVRDAGWLSEESQDDLPDRALPLVWIVDPIDGTRAYISGRADWTISVALVERGRPLIAALYAPVTDEMFLASRGGGATLNGAPIRASAPATALSGARLAGPKRYLERLSSLTPDTLAQPKVHSLALRIARVAHGALDAAVASPGSHDWDLAAADLLVHEAGGALTDFAGRPLIYNAHEAAHGALIAAGHARHDALIEPRARPRNRIRVELANRKNPRRRGSIRDRAMSAEPPANNKQLLHLVLGGELTELGGTEFKDLDKVEIVGVYPNYATAYVAWKAKAQQTVDNAHMRYFIVHLHRLLDPEADRPAGALERERCCHSGGSPPRPCSRRPSACWAAWYLRLVWRTSRVDRRAGTMSSTNDARNRRRSSRCGTASIS